MLSIRVMWNSELEPLSSYLFAVMGWTGLKGVEQDLSGLNGQRWWSTHLILLEPKIASSAACPVS